MFEKEHDGKLPFLDILVERTELVLRQVYIESPLFLVVHPLGILQPSKTKNEPHFHAATRSSYNTQQKQAQARNCFYHKRLARQRTP